VTTPDTRPLRLCLTCQAAIPVGSLACPECGADAPTEVGAEERLRPLWVRVGPLEARSVTVQRALGEGFKARRLLGAGGFGEVWEAFDVRLQRSVAVKVLRPELADSPSFRERFAHEARAVAKLRHPGIVPIYHVGEGEGLVYFIMPLLEGKTLRAALEEEGPLDPEEAIRLLAEAALALREAHQRGIVHRDLKPENVMLEGPERRLVLMDFGIAQSEDIGQGDTSAGLVLGSPEYMSPEQAKGTRLDSRSDIYSLGVVGYRMLAGRLPFEGETAREVLAHHILTPPEPLASVAPVPQALADAVMRCLAKQPEDRWQTADELLVTLGVDPQPTQTSLRRSSGLTRAGLRVAWRPRVRRLVFAGVAGLIVLALVAWAGARVSRLRRWERMAVAVTTRYHAVTDSLRALTDAFRAGSLTGAQAVQAQQAAQASADAAIDSAYGPILDDLSGWPEALRSGVEDALQNTIAATLVSDSLGPQASGTLGCVLEHGAASLTLRDRAAAENCWWSVTDASPILAPVEYAFDVRVIPGAAAADGFGLAWCAASAECRVLFFWLHNRAEWATYRPGAGLSDRITSAAHPPQAGGHRLRVRVERDRWRVWLDDAVVFDRSSSADAARLARASDLRLVVQNSALELRGPGSPQVVGVRP